MEIAEKKTGKKLMFVLARSLFEKKTAAEETKKASYKIKKIYFPSI